MLRGLDGRVNSRPATVRARRSGEPARSMATMTVIAAAAVQLDLAREDPTGNLERALKGLEEAASRGVRLAVLPEMWPTSFEPSAGEEALEWSSRAIEAVAEASRRLGLVVCGSAYGRGPTPAGLPFNRAHVIDRGEVVASHDKVHLFSPTAEALAFTAGELPPPVVETSIGRVAPLICYDLRFPELVRAAFRGGAEILAVSAQWPATRASHWRGLAVGRAVEGQWYVVAANRTGRDVVGRKGLELDFPGNSLLVSPHGEVLAEGGAGDLFVSADLDLEVVSRMRRAVPVQRDERRDLYGSW